MSTRAGGVRGRHVGSVLLAAVLSSMLALSGCSVLGGDDDGSPGADSSQEPGGSAGSGDHPTIPSQLLECGEKEADPDELQLAEVDLSSATWSMPEGFEESFLSVEDNPVEEVDTTWYAVPTEPELPTLNVLNVVLYTGLDWGDVAD